MDYAVTKNEESLEELWERTQIMHLEIEGSIDALKKKQKSDVDEEQKLLQQKKTSEFEKLSPSVQSLIRDKDKLKEKAKNTVGKSLLLGLGIIAIVFAVKFLIFDFTIVTDVVTYVICILAPLFLSTLVVSVRAAKLNKKANALQSMPEIAAYMQLVKQLTKETEDRISVINAENGKYAEEWRSIRQAEEECRYEDVKKMVISARYANTVFVYCKKFNISTHCMIEVDGIEVMNTKRKGTQAFRVNEGYHTVRVNHVYHSNIGGDVEHKEYYYTIQVNAAECPLFIVCEYIDASRVGSCEMVTYDRFVHFCGEELV